MAGAECGLWIAAGYVVQCLALQGTTAAKGALLAALQVVVVPAVVVLFPALRPKEGKQPTMKDWVCAGAALAGVALLELQGLTAPVASDAIAAPAQTQSFIVGCLPSFGRSAGNSTTTAGTTTTCKAASNAPLAAVVPCNAKHCTT